MRIRVKRELYADGSPRPRKTARSSMGTTRLELDEEGDFSLVTTPAVEVGAAKKVVIELD